MYYVYILKLRDQKYYSGFTSNLQRRYQEHKIGNILATKGHLPIKLICYFAFDNKYKALEFETYLKTGSGQAFRNKHFV